MSIKQSASLGSIHITKDAIATLAGVTACECYGVVGMASKKIFADGWAELLKRENYSKGVVIKQGTTGLIVDLYIIVMYGVRISAVVEELQGKVKYVLEKALEEKFESVNVFVQDLKVID